MSSLYSFSRAGFAVAGTCWRDDRTHVIDVCDHDEDGSVVRAIGINAIMDEQNFEELGQIVQIHQ